MSASKCSELKQKDQMLKKKIKKGANCVKACNIKHNYLPLPRELISIHKFYIKTLILLNGFGTEQINSC